MSSYFDQFDRVVFELSRKHREDLDFLKALEQHEATMVRDCELFAGDIETPQEVRDCIMAVISLKSIAADGKLGATRAVEEALMGRQSILSRDMHGLFHDIARMRYQMRYGMVFDDPGAAVEARDRCVEERERRKLPHPWQSKAPSNKPTLALNDAPPYCRKLLGRAV